MMISPFALQVLKLISGQIVSTISFFNFFLSGVPYGA